VVLNRQNWQKTASAFHDQCYGCCHGCTSRPHLPSTEQDCLGYGCGYCSGRYAFHLPRRFHHWLPSYCLGVPVRDSSTSPATAWLSHLNGSELDLQLRKFKLIRLHVTPRLTSRQIIVQITPPAINNIGWRTYIIFAVLNALWVPIIYFFFPETKGLELEDVDRLFSGEVSRVDLLEKAGDEERIEKFDGMERVEQIGRS
jgi:hypothetical protein